MADNEKYTLADILAAIKGSAGIKATIQRKLGCSRNTVDNYLKRYATAQAAYDEEVERIGDAAESVIIAAINNKDVDTAKWYATKKLRHRGYGDKNEVDVTTNGNDLPGVGIVVVLPDNGRQDRG